MIEDTLTGRQYNSLNVAKVFFACIVICYHTALLDGVMDHAYLSVEFFFIVSGFFIARKALVEKKSIYNIKKYLLNRFYRLYPHYILSLIVMILVSIVMGEKIQDSYNIGAEIFMVQTLGFTKGGINYPDWYISVLFWGSIIFYFVLLWAKKWGEFLCFILVVLFYVWVNLFNDGRTVGWGYFHGIYIPLFRGLANIALGIILYKIYFNIQKKGIYKNVWINRVLEFGSFIAGMVYMSISSNHDTLAVVFISVFILSILGERSLLEYVGRISFVKELSRYEYAAFLNHAAIILILEQNVFNIFEFRIAYRLALLLFIVLIYSIATQKFIDAIRKLKPIKKQC